MKAMAGSIRTWFKQLFNYNQLYIMLRADDLCSIYKMREFGITHTLTIDLGKPRVLLKELF